MVCTSSRVSNLSVRACKHTTVICTRFYGACVCLCVYDSYKNRESGWKLWKNFYFLQIFIPMRKAEDYLTWISAVRVSVTPVPPLYVLGRSHLFKRKTRFLFCSLHDHSQGRIIKSNFWHRYRGNAMPVLQLRVQQL